MKCPVCGGESKQTATGEYRCKYCGKRFTERDSVKRTKPTAPTKPIEPIKPSENHGRGGATDSGSEVYEKSVDGVLEITWSSKTCCYSGSGFVVSSEGHCITNAHVVTGGDGSHPSKVSVRIAGTDTTAQVVVIDDYRDGKGNGEDLALLKLSTFPQKAQVLELEDFSKVRIGEKVFVIGNSLGNGTCITGGIVSDKLRDVCGKPRLMTDCAINGGNSGGPIFNVSGKVIGAIVSAAIKSDGSNPEGMNYAIPSDIIKKFLDSALSRK